MESFFVGVLTKVLTNPEVQALLTKLFTDALNVVQADIKAEMEKLEGSLVESLEALPGEILGDATKDVEKLLHEITGTTEDIAGAVKGEVSPLIPTVDSLETMLVNILKGLPGGGIFGGLLGK